jgi:PST family polysaccharide transporter
MTSPPHQGADADLVDIRALGGRATGQLLLRVVFTRALTFGALIVLARTLSPAEFGAFAVVAIVVAVAVAVGDLGINGALIQQPAYPSRRELATARTLQLFVWVTGSVLIWVFAPLIASLAGLGSDGTAQIRVMTLTLLLWTLRHVPVAMLTRAMRFDVLARTEVMQVAVNHATTILLALNGFGVWSFVGGAVLQAATGAVLFNLAWRGWPGWGIDPSAARRMLAYGVRYQAAEGVGALRDVVVPLLGGLAGGVTAVGYLHFAWRNGQLAASFEEIAGRVSLPAFSRVASDRDRLARAARMAIVSVGLVVGAVQWWVIAVAPELVATLFGAQWAPAVVPLQLVCVGSLALAPTRILRSLLLAAGLPGTAMRAVIAGVLSLFVGFGVLTTLAGLAGAGAAFALASAFALLLHVRASPAVVAFPWIGFLRVNALGMVAGAAAWLANGAIDGSVGLVASGVVHLLLLGALASIIERDTIAWLRETWASARRRPSAHDAVSAE